MMSCLLSVEVGHTNESVSKAAAAATAADDDDDDDGDLQLRRSPGPDHADDSSRGLTRGAEVDPSLERSHLIIFIAQGDQ